MRHRAGRQGVDRVQLLTAGVGPTDPRGEIGESSCTGRGAEPAPQSRAGGSERVEIAGQQGQRDWWARLEVGKHCSKLLQLVRETDHVQMYDVNADQVRLGTD